MKNRLILIGIVTAAFLTGCKSWGSVDTEITPATTKVEQSHDMENPGTITDRVIEIKINPKSDAAPLKVKPVAAIIPLAGDPEVKPGEGSTDLNINGNKLSVPKGDSVTVTIKENIKESSKKVTDKSSAEAKGAGIKTNGPGGDKFNASAPNVNLKGVGDADGGDTTFKGVVAAVKSGSPLLYWFGAGLIVAGIVVAWGLKELRLGLAISAGGGALIGVAVLIEQFPWIFLAIPLAAIGIGAYSYFHLKNKNIALAAVADGVETTATTDPATIDKLKANIADAAGADYTKVKNVISDVKKKLGI